METSGFPTKSGVHSPRYISLDRALPTSAACQACRSKHQRCDGIQPICLRCKKGNRLCSYAPSRRGRSVAHLHPRKANVSEASTPTSDNIVEDLDVRLSRQCCSFIAHSLVIVPLITFLSSFTIIVPCTYRRRRWGRDKTEDCYQIRPCNRSRGKC